MPLPKHSIAIKPIGSFPMDVEPIDSKPIASVPIFEKIGENQLKQVISNEVRYDIAELIMQKEEIIRQRDSFVADRNRDIAEIDAIINEYNKL